MDDCELFILILIFNIYVPSETFGFCSSTCSPGMLQCLANCNCVEDSRRCDGIKDCLQGDDEWGCPSRVLNPCNCINQAECKKTAYIYFNFGPCSDGCIDGYYGYKCDNTGTGNCHCSEESECDTSSCSSCDKFWKGERCSYRNYAECHCKEKNECFKSNTVFPSYLTFKCSQCDSGYTGDKCNQYVNDGVKYVFIILAFPCAVIVMLLAKGFCGRGRNVNSERNTQSSSANDSVDNNNEASSTNDTVGNISESSSTNDSVRNGNEPSIGIQDLELELALEPDARLFFSDGLVLLAGNLPQLNGEESITLDSVFDNGPQEEVDLPPSYESIVTTEYPDEPPPSYDSISRPIDESTSSIQQTEGTVNNSFISDSDV